MYPLFPWAERSYVIPNCVTCLGLGGVKVSLWDEVVRVTCQLKHECDV